MKAQLKIGFAVVAGFGLGAITVDRLHAQAGPPAYVVSEVTLTDPDAYAREYVPLANKALAESGQMRLSAGGRTVSLSGAPPASRIVLSQFASLEQAQAAYTSPAYLEARKVGDRYGTLRIWLLPGSGVLAHLPHQSCNEGAKEGFAAAPSVVHELEKAEIQRQLLL